MAAEWYYVANGQQAGPVELQALQQMLAGGSITPTELVFGPGLSQWTPAGQVPAIVAAGVPGAVPGTPANTSMLGYRGVETATTGLSGVAMDALRQTKPWVRFVGIMAFIGAAFMVLAGFSMLFLSLAMAARSRRPNVLPGWLGGVYIVLAMFYIFPGILLTRYANKIGSLMRSQRMSDLESALTAQKSFWKYAGIAIIVVICLYLAAIAAVVVFRMRF